MLSAWTERAACGGLWDLFTPDGAHDAVTRAECLRICRSCPVLDACEALAREVTPTCGVWAGRVWSARSSSDLTGRPERR